MGAEEWMNEIILLPPFFCLPASPLHDAHGQVRLGFEREFHVVGEEAFKFGRAQIRSCGDLDDGEVGLSRDEALRGQSAHNSGIGSQRGDLGAAAGEGFGIGLRPDFVEGSEITLKEIDLAEEGDGRLRVARAGIEEVSTEFQHRIAFGAERVAQRTEIDELENIARDGSPTGIARITAGSDEAELAVYDGGVIAAPDASLAWEARLETLFIKAAIDEREQPLGCRFGRRDGPDNRRAEKADHQPGGHRGDGTGHPGETVGSGDAD